MRLIYSMIIIVVVILMSGCEDEKPIPEPEQLTREATGFYCSMIVIDHNGPKAQIFEHNREGAIWFTSVRDALVYNMLPGEAQDVQIIYVSDMSQAKKWQIPQKNLIWIRAEDAFYVIESRKRGGMGAKETVPFGNRDSADNFAREFGGNVVSFMDIPREYILGDTGEYDDPQY
ncbi:MAG: nitrous oxide reductase accessory protein NosL [Emcibacter sp.]|nr:nitrous oxide reductase accessory protein NosL [Emcibacter sp.]